MGIILGVREHLLALILPRQTEVDFQVSVFYPGSLLEAGREGTSLGELGSSRFRVVAVPGGDDLVALREQWTDLLSRALNPSFLHELPWSLAVATALKPGRVVFYLVYDDNRLVAVIPLEYRARWNGPVRMRALHLPSHSNIYLNDILLDRGYVDEDVLGAVLSAISNQAKGPRWDYCKLRKFNARSALYAYLQGRAVELREVGGSAFIPCRNAADIQGISKKAWKNANRLARKAADEVGPLALTHSAPGEPLEPWFEDFMRIESSGWKGEDGTGTSLLLDKKAQAFFRALIVDNAENWVTRVYVLNFGQVQVASVLCIYSGPVLYVLKTGYNEEYRAYGPGSILIKCLTEIMAENPEITAINLTTAPPWSERWHFDRASVHEVIITGKTMRARLYGQAYRLKCRLSPLKNRLVSAKQGNKV
jgi:CelD/BcsL family acetyltransferase involved in cellulose biosynthesis